MSRSFYARLHRHFGSKGSGYEKHKEAEQKLAELLERLPILSYLDRKSDPVLLETTGGSSSAKKRVAVIGAGFAGLSAAYTLQKAGFEVKVFESSNRVGGRVSSSNIESSEETGSRLAGVNVDNLPQKVIELGAELIGANHSLWLFFARKFGLGIDLMTTEDQFDLQGLKEPAYFTGKSIISDTWREVASQMKKVLNKITEDASQIGDPFKPWLTPGADVLDRITVYEMLNVYINELIDEPQHREYLLKLMEFQFQTNNLTDSKDQSYLGLLSSVKGGGGDDYWEETELFRCANGNASLAKSFSERIEAVNHSCTVTDIKIAENGKITLVIDNRQSDAFGEFDYLILAIPTFKLNGIKVDGIEINEANSFSTQSGKAIKYLTTFKKRFWLQTSLSPSGSHQSLGMVWEATDNQSIFNESATENNYVLTVFSGGENATKALKDSSKIDSHMEGLICQLYPLYSTTEPKTSNKKLFVDWDTIAGGGYSCPKKGEVTTTAKRLNEPYGKGKNIFFAGEHTCMAFFGYMEGALQSGVMAAQEIAKAENKSFDGLMVLYGEVIEREYHLKLQRYHEQEGRLVRQWNSPIEVKIKGEITERSDIKRSVSVFFQNQVYIAWTGHKDKGNNYPNILCSTFKSELKADCLDFSKEMKIVFKNIDNHKTNYSPALVVFSNQLFMGWTNADSTIAIVPITVEKDQIGSGEVIVIGEKKKKDQVGSGKVITTEEEKDKTSVKNQFLSKSVINFASYSHKLYMVWVSNEVEARGHLKIAESVDGANFHGIKTILLANTFQNESIALEVFDEKLYLAWIDVKATKIYIMVSKVEEASKGVDFNFYDEIKLSDGEMTETGLSMTVYNEELYLAYTNNKNEIKVYCTKDKLSQSRKESESFWFEPISLCKNLKDENLKNAGALCLIGFAFQGIYSGETK